MGREIQRAREEESMAVVVPRARLRAEIELGAIMDGLAESIADLPDAEVLAETREAGEDPAAIATRTRRVIAAAAATVPHYADCCDAARQAAADLERLRAVWRAVVVCLDDYQLPPGIEAAGRAAGLICDAVWPDAAPPGVSVLTGHGKRLARGGA